jgi:hypothetical protein
MRLPSFLLVSPFCKPFALVASPRLGLRLVSSHFGSWSFNGLSNFQRTNAGVKTHWIEASLISLESSWNLDVQNGLV